MPPTHVQRAHVLSPAGWRIGASLLNEMRDGINQVQFQKGLSMTQFLARYGTEEKRHAAAVAYAHRYLAEVQYRFNRRFDMSAILQRLLAAAVATTPRPERFLRLAEHCG